MITLDYSATGLERFIAIERQGPDDLVGCLEDQHRERFERELSRGRGLGYFALAVEANLSSLAAGQYWSEMNPASVVRSLLAFSVRHNLPVFFCPDRKHAARVVESLLSKYVPKIEKGLKAVA